MPIAEPGFSIASLVSNPIDSSKYVNCSGENSANLSKVNTQSSAVFRFLMHDYMNPGEGFYGFDTTY